MYSRCDCCPRVGPGGTVVYKGSTKVTPVVRYGTQLALCAKGFNWTTQYKNSKKQEIIDLDFLKPIETLAGFRILVAKDDDKSKELFKEHIKVPHPIFDPDFVLRDVY